MACVGRRSWRQDSVHDHVIPVDALVGRTWLVHYYKQEDVHIIETNGNIDPSPPKELEMNDFLNAYEMEIAVAVPTSVDDVVIDPRVPPVQRRQLMAFINSYRDVFAKNLSELGCTNILETDIVELPNAATLCAYDRTSPSVRRAIADILQECRRAGIVS